MTTTIGHPALRGRTAPRAIERRRRLSVPGIPTGSFWLLAAIVVVLNMFGLVMVMSASSVPAVRAGSVPWSLFERQALWTVLGTGALFATLMVSVDFWRRFTRPLMGIAIALLVLVLVPGVGVSVNGATRWLGVGPLQIQPSEFAKFALLLFVADLLDRRSDKISDWRWCLAPVVAYLGLVAALIMLQPNLGTTIIIAFMVLTMLLVAGVPLLGLGLTALAGTAVAAMFVAFTPFRRTRFLRFLNPWADPSNSGLQNVQSLVGFANGGVLGRGLGRSTAKWGFLPFAHTDFIFAVIGEEFGLVGALSVVLLFFGIACTGAWIAARAKDRFSMLVAAGITAWISVQAFMNIGAVIGIMPITGVPLPFVSFGGSSLMINLAAVGMLLNIARHPAEHLPRSPRRARRA
ncbi:putative lipid II flippase FtsW [Aquihabitans daechungensis]|uniref:putative lipid II flippase FtsW n=1 Tax=Aquihabitans daechungensis TaxID=1052257 RepID=UPI003BA170A6